MVAGFYTYIHRRASDGKVFYVGKGQRKRSHSLKGRTVRWIRTAAKHGLIVELVAFFWSESDALAHERELIAEYRAAGSPLCNLSDGGQGASGCKHTDEQRRRNSERGKGRKQSAETIAKRVAKLIGKKRSPEARAKISASRMGIKPSAHAIAMVKAANTGIVRSAEFKAKIVAALTGRPCSAETRAKIGAAHTGRTIPQDRRERISATLMGRKPTATERANFLAWVNDPVRRAKHSAALKGRPWSEKRRAAYEQRIST